MKPTIRWINTAKPRKTLNIIGNREDTVYPAHTLKTPGFSPYVNRSAFLEAVNIIKLIKETGDTEHARSYLNQLDDDIFVDV